MGGMEDERPRGISKRQAAWTEEKREAARQKALARRTERGIVSKGPLEERLEYGERPLVWTEKVRSAVRLTANGSMQKDIAAAMGVTQFAVSAWCTHPEFIRAVEDVRAEKHLAARERDLGLEEDVAGAVRETLGVWRAYMRGELEEADRRVGYLQPIVAKWLEKAIQFEDMSASQQGQTQAQQVNIYTTAREPYTIDG